MQPLLQGPFVSAVIYYLAWIMQTKTRSPWALWLPMVHWRL